MLWLLSLVNPGVLSQDCHGQSRDFCLRSVGCAWCDAKAVPSACYTADEAGRLPSAVFECVTPSVFIEYPLLIDSLRCSYRG